MNEDRPAITLTQGGLSTPLTALAGFGSAATFYDYFSASSHTGLEAIFTSVLFFYRRTTDQSLHLFVHHGIDFTTTGIAQPMSSVDMTFTGLPEATFVAVADDGPGELAKVGPATADADWNFNNNSDGGVISGFPFPGSWSVVVDPSFFSGIDSWVWADETGVVGDLALDTPVTLTALPTPSACRLDCSTPACGDGILDGGEVCDDGNVVGGDGCPANCLP